MGEVFVGFGGRKFLQRAASRPIGGGRCGGSVYAFRKRLMRGDKSYSTNAAVAVSNRYQSDFDPNIGSIFPLLLDNPSELC